MQYIDEVEIKHKRVLVRVDFDVAFNPDRTIADDIRIRENIPTLQYLLKNNNKIICIAKLNRPKMRDPQHSLKPVVERLKTYLPTVKITLIDDFLIEKQPFTEQKEGEILVLENIRFYPEEKKNDPEFAKKLAGIADIYINDGFAVSHRSEASVVGITSFLPSYGGFSLKKEISMLTKSIQNPQKPYIVILSGAKISTKIGVLDKFITIADTILLGGGIANTLFLAQGKQVGQSLVETEALDLAKDILGKAQQSKASLVLPTDAAIQTGEIKNIEQIGPDDKILDIGPASQKQFAEIISTAKTIIWNGPVGMFEDPKFRSGTDAIYDAVVANHNAVSILGGGDTLSAIADKPGKENISHISTAGGAMLEFIENNGHLPGLDALNKI